MKSLIDRPANGLTAAINLFCFPYAGGGAAVYRPWRQALGADVAVHLIQLPGRESRILETPYEDMERLLADLYDDMQPYLDKPLVLFGHSMGGKMAYEVAKRLAADKWDLRHLIISGSTVPHLPVENPVYHLPEQQFMDEIKRFQGTPREILDNEEILKFFLPMLRADFRMDETYCSPEPVVLDCPVTAFGGTADPEAGSEQIRMWETYTSACFRQQFFDGGHFFIRTAEAEVVGAVRDIVHYYIDESRGRDRWQRDIKKIM